MSTYRIYINTTASTSIEVEADSLEEAQDLALNQAPSLNIHNHFDLGDWEAEDDYYEIDGEVVDNPTTK